MYKSKIYFIYLIVLTLFGGMFAVGYLCDYIDSSSDNSNEMIIEIDWNELYPVQSDTQNVLTEQIDGESIKKRVENQYSAIISQCARIADNNANVIFGFDFFEKIGIKLQKSLYKGTRFSFGGIVEIDDNCLIKTESKFSLGDDLIKNYSDFNAYLQEIGIPLLYVQPMVLAETVDRSISYANWNRDQLVKGLKESGIDVLDLREYAKQEDFTQTEMFYKTDHHWRASLGPWAANIIAERINNDYFNIRDLELLEIDNFYKEEYNDTMFGSYGHFAGKNWSEPETETFLYPSYDTLFKIEIPNRGIQTVDDFRNALVNQNGLSDCISQGGYYSYESFLYGNTPLTKINNLQNDDGPRILVLRDSFALSVIPYLSIVCSELDSIDIRKAQGNFNGSVKRYIEEFQPDIVIILYSYAENMRIK